MTGSTVGKAPILQEAFIEKGRVEVLADFDLVGFSSFYSEFASSFLRSHVEEKFSRFETLDVFDDEFRVDEERRVTD